MASPRKSTRVKRTHKKEKINANRAKKARRALNKCAQCKE